MLDKHYFIASTAKKVKAGICFSPFLCFPQTNMIFIIIIFYLLVLLQVMPLFALKLLKTILIFLVFLKENCCSCHRLFFPSLVKEIKQTDFAQRLLGQNFLLLLSELEVLCEGKWLPIPSVTYFLAARALHHWIFRCAQPLKNLHKI